MIIAGDAELENVEIDGSLIVSGSLNHVRKVRNLKVTAKNYVQLEEINPDDKSIEDSLRIRGYRSQNTQIATQI